MKYFSFYPRSLLMQTLCCSVFLTAPAYLFCYWYWPGSDDFIFYTNILDMFSEQLWSGELYPRWLHDAEYGQGAPVFVYYAPLFFYVGSLWQWLAELDTHGFFRLLMTVNLFHIASVFGMYAWLRHHFDTKQAHVGALFYAFFPDLVNFLHSYGVGAIALQSIFPWCMWMAEKAIRDRHPLCLPMLAVFASLLIYAHGLYGIMFSALLSSYVIFLCRNDWRMLFRVVPYGLLAIGLAAPYWLVARLNMPYFDQHDAFSSNKFNWQDNFLSPYETLLCFLMVGLPILWAILDCISCKRRIRLNGTSWFWIGVLCAAIFLSTPLSVLVWHHLDSMKYFQFPWRFYYPMLPAAIFICLALLPAQSMKRLCIMLLFPYLIVGILAIDTNYVSNYIPDILEGHRIFSDTSGVGMEYHTSLPKNTFLGGEFAYNLALACLLVILLDLWRRHRIYIATQ